MSDAQINETYDFPSVLAAAREASSEIALITDSQHIISYASEAFAAMSGYSAAELMGRNPRFLQGPGSDPHTVRQLREVLGSGEIFDGEILNYRKDGSAFWTSLKVVPLRLGSDATITHFVSLQRDISNQVALLKHLQNQALQDYVTGLPNRAAAEQAAEEALSHANCPDSTVAVGLIDLDDFRRVNNTLGHAAGDEVLSQWAARVLSRLRDQDVLARMGGDEFILILKNIRRSTAQEDLTRVLERVRGAVDTPFTVADRQVRIGMSLGITVVPQGATDSQSILLSADQALYEAKQRRNRRDVWWKMGVPPSPTSASVRAHPRAGTGSSVSTNNYREALRSDSVEVHLQPVVDLRDGSVHLFEALARLRLPDGHLARPHEFLPYLGADDEHALFMGVLNSALEVLAAWDQLGIHHKVSVNLPPALLTNRSKAELVQKLLDAHNIRPERLGLELLESDVVSLEDQRATLRELVDLGVGLAMDDLGSGYSSLQRLSSFPFSAIKLDRGLLFNVMDRPIETLSILATLIQLGRDLGMNVALEGLETRSLTEAAIALGAPLGQGFYLARPMSPDDCLRWVASFALQSQSFPIQTPLGALAYHWHFARLAAPHPLALENCPVTHFINTTPASDDVKTWHAQQHSAAGMQPGSSQLLIDWLTRQIRLQNSEESAGRTVSTV